MVDPISVFTDIAPGGAPDGTASDEPSFDAVFARFLMREVRRSMPSGGPFDGSGLEAYQSLFDEVIADHIAASGTLGLDQLVAGSAQPASAVSPRRAAALPVSGGRISSGYGMRTDPIDGTHRHHHGIDIAAPAGSPIRAVRSGTVTFAGTRDGYGRLVIVDHGNGLQTRYGHCRDLKIVAGARVAAGQTIATVGATGRATGPHLHFEARQDDHSIDPGPLLHSTQSGSAHSTPDPMIR